MIFQLAEVAPAAPLVIEALPPLIILSGLFVALGLVMLIDGFVRALFGAVESLFSHIPGLGGLTSGAIHNAEHAISHALGTAISGIESRIATQFHNLARIVSHFWHMFEQSAANLYDIAKLVAGAATYPDINALQRRLRGLIHAAEHSADVAIAHALHLAKSFTHSVAQGVYPRLRELEHEVTKTIPKEIKRTRALAKEAEADATRAWNLVKTRPWEIGTTAFAGAVAIALSTLGLDWIKCNSANSFFRKAGCGFWKLLEDALGIIATIALAVFGVLRPQDLAQAAVEAVDAVEPIIAKILDS